MYSGVHLTVIRVHLRYAYVKKVSKMPQVGKARGKAQDAGWRGSPEGWLEAAYEALKESGIDAVRVMPLAKRLGLSRTSFYWFFEDREQIGSASCRERVCQYV